MENYFLPMFPAARISTSRGTSTQKKIFPVDAGRPPLALVLGGRAAFQEWKLHLVENPEDEDGAFRGAEEDAPAPFTDQQAALESRSGDGVDRSYI